ncbi:MAG: hypothetical protein FWG31_04090 [Oscillospiraceae bacterium]|nr:hypothetical protein [Oscillospiraceae bacterium]
MDSESLYREQKKVRPKIEDVLNGYLKGENLKNALDFVSWLRANKMNPQWGSANSWSATYRKVRVCYLKLYNGSWYIWPSGQRDEYLNEFINDENIKEKVIAGIHPCTKCVHMCNNGDGHSVVICGEKYHHTCGHFVIRLRDPDAATLEHMKGLIIHKNNDI